MKKFIVLLVFVWMTVPASAQFAIKGGWSCIENEFESGNHRGSFMKAEMKACLSTLCAVMTLKCIHRENFHFLKGNHENILNETAGGDYAFCKYADEGEMVKIFISEYYGDDVLYTG